MIDTLNHTKKWNSIEQVKKANDAIPHYWFEPASMRFFNTVIETDILFDRYFITSERFEKNRDYPKRYSIRFVKDDGRVVTLGEFQEYKTLADAKEALRGYARQ